MININLYFFTYATCLYICIHLIKAYVACIHVVFIYIKDWLIQKCNTDQTDIYLISNLSENYYY